MNLREIDRLVAEKVMGWKVSKGRSGLEWYEANENGKFEFIRSVTDFEPSTDIRDAWQVVEKLKIAVIPQAGDPPTDMKYLAEIDRQPFGDNYEAYAGTAELAICLVALKSVGVNIE
ncbi:hypothetical protein NST81_01835 [Bacillus sp. FSL W8-0223]|uniref:BC1872 family protein n=1 Tax=Bacillus sp. FSL W8-0223 TaxID=2954595 RepID=UPI0030FBC6D2